MCSVTALLSTGFVKLGQPQPESPPEPKKGGAKTNGRGRKAAQPEPQQPSEPAYDFDDDIPF